ncbi:MAG: preprotein translocase subunit SecY [Deltaproteobacteria bacterium]|nr:preprotein translocase subunit SecY [Deltaproteobacteria bacterium]
MIGGIENIPRIPELRRRIGITLLLLAVYRVGVFIPTPGVNSGALADFFSQAQNTLFGIINLFSGGAFEQFSIFALGIMPYISASIILQLLTVVVPRLEELSKEGELGRKKIIQYTRYGTVVLSIIQSLGISIGLESLKSPTDVAIVQSAGWSFRLMTVLTLTSGTAFIMWLGEQITEKGIGNGISLIIYAGIVTRLPSAATNSFELIRTGEMNLLTVLFILALAVGVVGIIIFMERGQRRIPVQYSQRVIGRRVYGGQSSFLPLKLNTSGVIPPIFASSLLMFPLTIANFIQAPWIVWFRDHLDPRSTVYNLVYGGLILFFCYFYTAIVFNPVDVSENLRKYGGYVPGIRPGKSTADYLDRILTRITLSGAIYVALVCVLPSMLVMSLNVPFLFGGTALLIVVGVALDTVGQIESHLLTRQYEGFVKGGRIRGRRG